MSSLDRFIRLVRYLRPYRFRLGAAFVCSALVAALSGAYAWLVKPVLDEGRAAIRQLVPQIEAARQTGNQAQWDALVDKLGEHWDTMREAYLKSALDPTIRARMAKAIDEMIQGGHPHRP